MQSGIAERCEREGEAVSYRKGDQMEHEGDPSRWFGYVTDGRFKYVTHGISDDREHITWFSFAGEFVDDYPNCLDGHPDQLLPLMQIFARFRYVIPVVC
ncbi:MAG: hypothetical protein IKD75_03615 [Prevotella sp.]|nr:hypothetical protein [Prevotella sp.]